VLAQEFEKAAALRDQERELRHTIRETKKGWSEARSESRAVVDGDDVAEVVSKMTGVPVAKLEEKESEKLLRMEDELSKFVVGQDPAVQAIAKAVRRNRAGLRDPRRPIGSFVFLGPTGVGKTELARVLARFLFQDEDALIRIDMSEFMEKFNVSRLVGAPPGYVGYEEGGQLTEKVRRKPYSVVLLDEIEKAHPDVFNILLQVLDDGQLTDSMRRKVNFKNTVLIMTSNLGTRQIKGASLGFRKPDEGTTYSKMKDTVMDEVKRTFNPEFLNRIDEIIVFRALDVEDMQKIVKILLDQVGTRLKRKDISLNFTQEALDFLIEKGFDPALGARPLRRTIQRLVEDPLAELVLRGIIREKCTVEVARKGDEITFSECGK
jgi:ATP-dependent Clp protease ATP-binding subunit ClpC